MKTETKKFGILDALRSIFSSEIDCEENYEMGVTLPKELLEVKDKIDAKAKKVTQGFNSSGKSVSKKNDVVEKFNPETIKAMRGKHQEVVDAQAKKQEDREIGD